MLSDVRTAVDSSVPQHISLALSNTCLQCFSFWEILSSLWYLYSSCDCSQSRIPSWKHSFCKGWRADLVKVLWRTDEGGAVVQKWSDCLTPSVINCGLWLHTRLHILAEGGREKCGNEPKSNTQWTEVLLPVCTCVTTRFLKALVLHTQHTWCRCTHQHPRDINKHC